MSHEAYVHIRDLRVEFRRDGQTVNAVNGVSFDVQKGEVMALIGESGSGKSVTLRTLMRLHPPKSSVLSGTLRVGEEEVLKMSASAAAALPRRALRDDFPGAVAGLRPGLYRGPADCRRAASAMKGLSRQAARERALEALRQVRIPSPERRLDAYPHEMSGGSRQRAMIALALSCNPPQPLLADEPTTALDATVQPDPDLLREQQKQRDLSIIFVTHDIGAAVEIADRVAVMYAGRIVEEASIEEILYRPRHPYTRAPLGRPAERGAEKGRRAALYPRLAAGSLASAARLRVCRTLSARAPCLCAEPAGYRTGRAASRGELPSLA